MAHRTDNGLSIAGWAIGPPYSIVGWAMGPPYSPSVVLETPGNDAAQIS